jgi:hypothetical protein
LDLEENFQKVVYDYPLKIISKKHIQKAAYDPEENF